MKRKMLLCAALAGMLCFSCIQAEDPNAEADIEECVILNADGQPDPNIKGNVVVTNTRVMAQATPYIDLTKLKLEVTLTEGATISPDPSQVLDYSSIQKFTVTSESGEWKKEYTVTIDTFDLPVKYKFEQSELSESRKYFEFYETTEGKEGIIRQNIWASGNAGFSLTGAAATPEGFPTVPIAKGKEGMGVSLETKSTGPFGEMVDMPIAAGNLFIGSFDVANALNDAMRATRFGLAFGKKPVEFKGWYKYRRGEVFTVVGEDGKATPDLTKQDTCDIYAVLYESAGLDQGTLDGNNVLSSPNIVALARVKIPEENILSAGEDIDASEWHYFDISFEELKPFDVEKSRNYEYNLAVVFTSSIQGAAFKGAVGSVLYVDEVEVVCE